jgi:hypothetical protein
VVAPVMNRFTGLIKQLQANHEAGFRYDDPAQIEKSHPAGGDG